MGGTAATAEGMCSLARTVVMIGLMGAGKTSIGSRLAEALGAPFRDSDAEIEAAASMSVAEIFETHGEAYFRAGERRVIARLMGEGPHVLSTGGGAFMDAETRALIRQQAVSIWLKADLDTLLVRTAGRGHRPLLNRGNARATLVRLMTERYPVYAEADIAIESRLGQTHEDTVERIVEALRARPDVIAEG